MSVGAAGDRLAELLEQWLAGVEMHERYLALDDDAYAQVQDWPSHQRPTRWILDLARTRCMELKRQLEERRGRGDDSFAEALELMAFLANLLGSEHLERFIPMPSPGAAARPPAPESRSGTAPRAAGSRDTRAAAASSSPAAPPSAERAARPKPVADGGGVARPATTARAGRPSATPPAPRRSAATPAAGAPPASVDARSATVIADAVRLLNWGRPWPELAGLIARLADRPAETEVWEILRRHRAEISARSSPASD